ncbi:MAG TPA: alpha/beta fold hydrolase [Rhodanobacteraceae bacterium]|nr:alpha/beta fold hydrolase [Rhodanobacteraceae bacterium]
MKVQRILFALTLVVCASSSIAADAVSFDDLAKHAQFKQVKISPDGAYLAATSVLKDGQTVLTIVDLATRKIRNLAPRGNNDVLDFWWASPKRVLYTEAEHDGGWDSPLSTGELLGVNADGGSQATLSDYGENAEFLSRIKGDMNHVLVSIADSDKSGSAGALTEVRKMDVRDGREVKVGIAPMREASYLVDHTGNVRFAWSDDLDGKRLIYTRAVGGGNKDWQLLQQASADRDVPIAFNADDSAAWFTCPGKPSGFGICRFDPATQAMTQVWSNPDVEADGLMQGSADDSVMGVGFTDGRPAISVFDPNSPDAKALVSLMQQYPGEDAGFVSGTDDGSKAVALVEADADPGTFFLYDKASGKFSPLLQRASWINPETLARKQPISLSARDGLKLQGYVTFPPGKENAKNLPMVVFVHGGPFGVRDEWDYDPYVQAMATHGYAVLQVNYRGSSGYGYDFEKAGYREWGGKMQDDVTDATRWAIQQGIADPHRICIYGGSYGGYAALEGAVKEPDLYKCAIGYVGVYDLNLMYNSGSDATQSIYGKKFLERTLGTDTTVLAQHSPIDQLNNLKAKVMLIVGGRDTRVPEVQGKNLHMALLQRHVEHEWLYKPDEWHGFYDESNIAELFAKVDAFLDANIGSGTAEHSSASQ